MSALPSGWTVKRHSTWLHRRLTSRSTIYHYEREGLTIKKAGRSWMLVHNYHDTGHRFKTAMEAIEHAEDARIHGH